MTRRKKPSGRLNRGPYTADQIIAALVRLGGVRHPSKQHSQCFKMPNGGKVTVSTGWNKDPITINDRVYRNICKVGGFTSKQFQAALADRTD